MVFGCQFGEPDDIGGQTAESPLAESACSDLTANQDVGGRDPVGPVACLAFSSESSPIQTLWT